jgi:DNA invertase Pin-like site-specific DNA recombinase
LPFSAILQQDNESKFARNFRARRIHSQDQPREGDTVVVWKLDRLSRSLKDVLHIMERIALTGAGFRSVTENIDTTTPARAHDDANGRFVC